MIDVALSPCPNDTFLFFPWIMGYVGDSFPLQAHFYDIEQLNHHALAKRYLLTKLSIATYYKMSHHYELLPIGAALGHNQGPKLVGPSPYTLSDLKTLRVAIPGKETTANLLLTRFVPELGERYFCLYHEVIELIKKGRVDCGVIIHETRFTFANEGLYEIADLGQLFYEQTAHPLPLGALVLKRESFFLKEKISALLKESLAFAKKYPEKGKEFILEKSQEKDQSIIEQHIALYVNSETEELSKKGLRAIELLCNF